MAFNRRPSASNTPADNASRNKVAGYLNIGIMTKQGLKRLGGQGIGLRESHPLEGLILETIANANGDAKVLEKTLKEICGRIVLTYGEATPEGAKFEF